MRSHASFDKERNIRDCDRNLCCTIWAIGTEWVYLSEGPVVGGRLEGVGSPLPHNGPRDQAGLHILQNVSQHLNHPHTQITSLLTEQLTIEMNARDTTVIDIKLKLCRHR